MACSHARRQKRSLRQLLGVTRASQAALYPHSLHQQACLRGYQSVPAPPANTPSSLLHGHFAHSLAARVIISHFCLCPPLALPANYCPSTRHDSTSNLLPRVSCSFETRQMPTRRPALARRFEIFRQVSASGHHVEFVSEARGCSSLDSRCLAMARGNDRYEDRDFMVLSLKKRARKERPISTACASASGTQVLRLALS